MKIQKLEQLRELIKEGWALSNTLVRQDDWSRHAREGSSQRVLLKQGAYRLKSPSGDIIPVEYCEGTLDEHSFKKGDQVRCKTGYDNVGDHLDPWYGGHGYQEGVTCVITSNDMVPTSNKQGNGGGIFARALELVEAKSSGHIFKFDTQIDHPTIIVEAVKDCDEWFNKGDKFKARYKDSRMCLIWNPANTHDSNKISQFGVPGSFKVIEELDVKDEEVEVSKPKTINPHCEVGDIVNYVNDSDPVDYIISKVYENDFVIRYKDNDYTRRNTLITEGTIVIISKGIVPQPVIEEQQVKREGYHVRSNDYISKRSEEREIDGLMDSLLRSKRRNSSTARASKIKSIIEEDYRED